MRLSWHEKRPDLLTDVRTAIAPYPDLRLEIIGSVVRVLGTFPVLDESGIAVDRFAIEIWFLDDYPDVLPAIREVGGRIPWTLERHIFPKARACCIIVPEEWFFTEQRRTFGDYLNGPVRNYFLGQSLVERGHAWPFGERLHGYDGLVQAYGESLSIHDPKELETTLDYLAAKQVKGHWPCPCGSGQRIRNCHHARISSLRDRIPRHAAKRAYERLRQHKAIAMVHSKD